ncbi:MAG: exodeoxyribonuclease VII large subunit [Corallococcus sp.]|nr:exodeoxyribonuclease VII large subunit [Corallococcus sp.]MCM1359705.1 exodeoxyribonuclease VII large subunit [Corallococcus sp.]MCM1395414.1 exodeoxyribonuclease VII large subunit [Corallococcus sp.]
MTITVSQLNNYVHGLFDVDGVLNDLSVCGEIVNVKPSRDGWFFSVKDDNASVDCFCYGGATEPVSGAMAVVEGRLNYWVKSGRVSFYARRISLTKDTGAAYLKFLQLKEQLQKEGLFDESRKKSIPKSCAKIGVVTSATGAVIHDIDEVAHRRQPFCDVVLYPVKVQGEGADLEIAQGILYLAQTDVDVIIVGRGGGSNEDLSVFNSEVLVRAVAACDKPVVSAVGHGVDYTLCDFASDKRAVTPSEAAEFVTLDAAAEKQKISVILQKQSGIIARTVKHRKYVAVLSATRAGNALQRNLDTARRKVTQRLRSNMQSVSSKCAEVQNLLDKTLARLNAANPATVLRRGFAYVSQGEDKVASVSQVEVGATVRVTLFDGAFSATVENKETK